MFVGDAEVAKLFIERCEYRLSILSNVFHLTYIDSNIGEAWFWNVNSYGYLFLHEFAAGPSHIVVCSTCMEKSIENATHEIENQIKDISSIMNEVNVILLGLPSQDNPHGKPPEVRLTHPRCQYCQLSCSGGAARAT